MFSREKPDVYLLIFPPPRKTPTHHVKILLLQLFSSSLETFAHYAHEKYPMEVITQKLS